MRCDCAELSSVFISGACQTVFAGLYDGAISADGNRYIIIMTNSKVPMLISISKIGKLNSLFFLLSMAGKGRNLFFRFCRPWSKLKAQGSDRSKLKLRPVRIQTLN